MTNEEAVAVWLRVMATPRPTPESCREAGLTKEESLLLLLGAGSRTRLAAALVANGLTAAEVVEMGLGALHLPGFGPKQAKNAATMARVEKLYA